MADTAKCYICGKVKPLDKMKPCGNGVFRCAGHRVQTVLNANPEKKARAWEITIPEMKIIVREVTR